MAGIYINQQIVKTTAEWAGDSTVYPANILLFEKLESGKFSIAVTDGVNTFANLNKVATDIDAYSKTESDERYPLKNDVYTKQETYTKTEADSKFALASGQLYRIDIQNLLSYETMSNYPIESINNIIGMTLDEFLNGGYYLRCYFPQYIARVQQKTYYDDSDVFHFRVLFTVIESDYVKDITIDQARGSDTCSITVVKKQLVTNIVAISESNYANLSSKDSSTLYLIY